MTRSLITGSNGSVAYYLREWLERNPGAQIFGLSRPDCDLNNFEAVCARLEVSKPDVIYHCASDANVRESWIYPREVIENNVNGTVNLFEAIRAVGIRPVVQVCSTSEVYGSPWHWPIGEDWQLAPLNPYAVSKAAQDMLASIYEKAYGIPVVITRAFGYINPRRADLALISFARQIAEIEAGRRHVLKHGNLDTYRTFCDVRDIVKAYELAASLGEGVYNIGSSERISVEQCLAALCDMATVAIPREFDQALARPADVTNIVPDCTRFRQRTGWEPQISFKESLTWLLNYCRQEVQHGAMVKDALGEPAGA